jgi:uncharacterized protein YndB with AHSA1/START domain
MVVRSELVFTRVVAAPRDLVFQAWTEPEHVAMWWGPHKYTNPVCEVDARPGGAINIHMLGPDGVVYPTVGAFREVVAPERLVFTTALMVGQGRKLIEELNTVTFEEQDGRTTLMLHVAVIDLTAESESYVGSLEEGWKQSLERLTASIRALEA